MIEPMPYTPAELAEIHRQKALVARDGASPEAIQAFCDGARRASGWDRMAGLRDITHSSGATAP